jgi:hypothetical protein
MYDNFEISEWAPLISVVNVIASVFNHDEFDVCEYKGFSPVCHFCLF